MPTIKVRRADGTKEGDPIISILAAEVSALRERGRNELDAQATDKLENVYDVPYSPDLVLCDIVDIKEYDTGKVVRGKVIKLDHSFTLPEAITTLTIEALA
ncbi:hypothetical protein NVP1215B_084 [Vibrio phage 1.215.B._10N.222.54.F7]|nr:hypothetical protein NVP1215A_084 [Vibrio phage 1.215.A._10N.222.54.F7]AUR96107.1 hypothetical protein NVP1215B_084 [Vibrio phage 1.215.B._10N.222.54.F7]